MLEGLASWFVGERLEGALQCDRLNIHWKVVSNFTNIVISFFSFALSILGCFAFYLGESWITQTV